MNVKVNEHSGFVKAAYNSKTIPDYFKQLKMSEYYTFVICNDGNCDVLAYMHNYRLEKDEIISIIPDIFFKIESISKDCTFSFISFDKHLIKNQYIFNNTLKYIPYIFKKPAVHTDNHLAQYINRYIKLIEDTLEIEAFNPSMEYYESLFMTFVCSIGSLYAVNESRIDLTKRKDEIMENFIYLTTLHYKSQRGLKFYAKEMSLSPQHLSYIIKKKTGITVTDFIARLIITDAQSKLRSTKTGIQEIAFSLNFPDVSTFGKYFKRYTGDSPKQYRERYDKLL